MRAQADLGLTHDVDRHCDPRRAPRPHPCPLLGSRSRPGAFLSRCSIVFEINADERIVERSSVRPRRHRRRLRGTRCPLPRRRSGRPRAHVVGHRGCVRGVQPARTSRDDTGLGHHRPPAARNVDASDLTASRRFGTSRRTSASTSKRCIGSAISERSSPMRRMGPRERASTPSGE